ncbi:unnamed protein product, partial [Porites evermanni]
MADANFEKFEPGVMKVTQKEMADAKLPLSGRDYCAHLLIPLLKCRKETYMVPWKCHHEKHLWERCEYDDFMYRVREKERQKLKLNNKVCARSLLTLLICYKIQCNIIFTPLVI